MKRYQILDHAILIAGVLFLLIPIWIVFASSTHRPEILLADGLQFWFGDYFWETYSTVLFKGSGFTGQVNALLMLQNSMILGLGFSIGKIAISTIAAYAIVYFRFPAGNLIFWMIFSSLLLPLEVRILPSYEVVSDVLAPVMWLGQILYLDEVASWIKGEPVVFDIKLSLLNSYTGLILPLIASATATFFFRQFFKSVPDELLESARIDNAGPFRFFVDILWPLSTTMVAAIFIIMFVVGWNQYLWPILMTTDEGYYTIVMGIKQILNELEGNNVPKYNEAMALAILALLPPVLVVVIFQRWFVKGLVETEK